MELTEGCELTWMRQPHYYMGLYSYTYSAGLTLATRPRLTSPPRVRAPWRAGRAMLGSRQHARSARLAAWQASHLSTPDALEHTIAYISGIIDEIAALTEEINGITLD